MVVTRGERSKFQKDEMSTRKKVSEANTNFRNYNSQQKPYNMT